MARPEYDDRLILFEKIRRDKIFAGISGLLLKGEDQNDSIKDVFYKTQRELLRNYPGSGITGNYLQNHLCGLLAAEDNAFARMAEKGAFEKPAINHEEKLALQLASREIKLMKPVYDFDFENYISGINGCGDICPGPANVAGAEIKAEIRTGTDGPSPLQLIHEAMSLEDSGEAALSLAGYYRKFGCGDIGAAPAFIADDKGLISQAFIDNITMDDLAGIDRQKQALTENIEILLAGYNANNMLLYGDSGTGKSSSVKALLNLYSGKGLKLISVSKDKLHLLPAVFEKIEDRGMKFIIFIDDLSFEENEYEFKAFKSIIEGRVAPKPRNAVFIVTTNRKNIVKESWSDREGTDDVRRRDNIEEKRSLSDRFGITLIYPAPDKTGYLQIVRNMAEKAGLDIEEKELFSEALKWEIRHGGRSGRTARQFVDYIAGIKAIRREAKEEEE